LIIPGDVIKVEAWLLRDLAYIFARAARRGHRPREDEMLELMRAADIPIPEYVPPRRSTSSAGYFAAMDSILFWGNMIYIYIYDIYIYTNCI
jgi:hypothetical protein